MKTKTIVVLLITLLTIRAEAQSVLFDFGNAPQYTPLPINLTVSGITAHFSATGQGYSIQLATCQGLNPLGFSGLCIYPSSINAADLVADFSTPLTDFSILYAPEEYACDSSATMRVTTYLNGALVGTTTTNAQAGTWPTETLQFSSTQTFNRVVVHYDKGPVTGGDWGPVFMADNMAVTPAPLPPSLQISRLANQIQLAWPTDTAVFTLQWNTNLLNGGTWWTVTNTPVITGTNQTVTLSGATNKSYSVTA